VRRAGEAIVRHFLRSGSQALESLRFDRLIAHLQGEGLADTAVRRPSAAPVRRFAARYSHKSSMNLSVNSANAGQQAAQECAAIAADLERLKALIAEAGDKLLASFNQVAAVTPRLAGAERDRAALDNAVTVAVTSLQFQDMANQLTAHAQRRLAVLQDCVKQLSTNDADPLLATTRLQPVKQIGMGAGSVDLF